MMKEEIAKKVCIACGKCKELKGDCYLAKNIASMFEGDEKLGAFGYEIGAPIYIIIPGDDNIYEKVCRSVLITKEGITINGVWSMNEAFPTREAAEKKQGEN